MWENGSALSEREFEPWGGVVFIYKATERGPAGETHFSKQRLLL